MRIREFLDFISPLYALQTLEGYVAPCPASHPLSWFSDCVNHIDEGYEGSLDRTPDA
jgi:hypothetical protein